VARTGDKRGALISLVARSVGRRPLGRPRHRWEYILIELQKVQLERELEGSS